MIIKQLQLSDVEKYENKIAIYIQTCFEVTYHGRFDKLVEEKMKSLKTHLETGDAHLFGAIKDNNIIGFLWAYRVFNPSQNSFHVAYIVVDEKVRGQGIGHKLLDAVEKKAQEIGLERIELIVGADNEKAIQFYLKEEFCKERYILGKSISKAVTESLND